MPITKKKMARHAFFFPVVGDYYRGSLLAFLSLSLSHSLCPPPSSLSLDTSHRLAEDA